MFGAVLGDFLGSVYEGGCSARRDVPLVSFGACVTDDSVHTCAIAQAILENEDPAVLLRDWTLRHPGRGYGGGFIEWAHTPSKGPYNSFGNGSLMRVSPAIALSRTLEQARAQARHATAVTHNHDVALKAVDAYAHALWAALQGAGLPRVLVLLESAGYRRHSVEQQHEEGRFTLRADETLCDVVSCLAESSSYEDCMRVCFYHGGDTDTLCAIAGPLAECIWGIDPQLVEQALPGIPSEFVDVLEREYGQLRELHPRLFA